MLSRNELELLWFIMNGSNQRSLFDDGSSRGRPPISPAGQQSAAGDDLVRGPAFRRSTGQSSLGAITANSPSRSSVVSGLNDRRAQSADNTTTAPKILLFDVSRCWLVVVGGLERLVVWVVFRIRNNIGRLSIWRSPTRTLMPTAARLVRFVTVNSFSVTAWSRSYFFSSSPFPNYSACDSAQEVGTYYN